MLHKKVKNIKDFVELIIFILVSPVIGIVMFIGMFATSVAMVCIYIKDIFIKRFYE
tara:strand:+ start:183 stop:350 length:168 start_codon:yes stop_codon:yes gene_type:complete